MIQPPKNEIIWIQICIDGVTKYVITSTSLRGMYYAYKVDGESLIKTKYKSANPLELEEKLFEIKE